MAKEDAARLKLIHLVYGLIAAGVIIGLAIGGMGKQQIINTENIAQKVSTEVFDMHQQQQLQESKRTNKTLDKMDLKLEALLKK